MKLECLDCPNCGAPVIPASGYQQSWGVGSWTWTSEDEATCLDCGLHLRATYVVHDDGRSGMEAVEVRKKEGTP